MSPYEIVLIIFGAIGIAYGGIQLGILIERKK